MCKLCFFGDENKESQQCIKLVFFCLLPLLQLICLINDDGWQDWPFLQSQTQMEANLCHLELRPGLCDEHEETFAGHTLQALRKPINSLRTSSRAVILGLCKCCKNSLKAEPGSTPRGDTVGPRLMTKLLNSLRLSRVVNAKSFKAFDLNCAMSWSFNWAANAWELM